MSRVTELAEKYGITSNRNSKLREDLREGISLRDHFAGLALPGLIVTKPDDVTLDLVAKAAYNVADAMMAERDKAI